MSKYERKGIEKKNHKDFEKNMNKKIRNVSGVSRIFSAFVEKTVLIRKILLFFGLKKPY